jgi:putative DNA-invertase from lambdoid prophage Rac
MVYGYVRVSTDKQNTENQKFEIYNYTENRDIPVDKWVIETESGRKSYKKRRLGDIINFMDKGDILITTEISRLGRSLTEIMTILNEFIEKDCKIYTVKYPLKNNIPIFLLEQGVATPCSIRNG